MFVPVVELGIVVVELFSVRLGLQFPIVLLRLHQAPYYNLKIFCPIFQDIVGK